MKKRTFTSLKDANKLWRKLNKKYGSRVDIVFYFNQKKYVVLFGYEMDYEDTNCVLDYKLQGIEWEFESLM